MDKEPKEGKKRRKSKVGAINSNFELDDMTEIDKKKDRYSQLLCCIPNRYSHNTWQNIRLLSMVLEFKITLYQTLKFQTCSS